MQMRYWFFIGLALPITLMCADKVENQEKSKSQVVAQVPATPTAQAVQQIKAALAQDEQKTQAAGAEAKKLNEEEERNKQQNGEYLATIEKALEMVKQKLPSSFIPKIAKPKEQVTNIGVFGGIYDFAEYHSLSHEAYLRKHVENETLRIALATADDRRSKFGHAANELARKAKVRKFKNIAKRMGELVAWSNSYDIALNCDDLNLMRETTIDQLNTCIATLSLIDAKKASLITPLAPQQQPK